MNEITLIDVEGNEKTPETSDELINTLSDFSGFKNAGGGSGTDSSLDIGKLKELFALLVNTPQRYINEKPEEPKVGDIFVTTDDNEAVLSAEQWTGTEWILLYNIDLTALIADDLKSSKIKTYSIDKIQEILEQRVSELLDGAPEAYDTLKEIADYISNDKNLAASILQAIALKADITDLEKLIILNQGAGNLYPGGDWSFVSSADGKSGTLNQLRTSGSPNFIYQIPVERTEATEGLIAWLVADADWTTIQGLGGTPNINGGRNITIPRWTAIIGRFVKGSDRKGVSFYALAYNHNANTRLLQAGDVFICACMGDAANGDCNLLWGNGQVIGGNVQLKRGLLYDTGKADQTALDKEITNRKAGDNTLQTNIDNLANVTPQRFEDEKPNNPKVGDIFVNRDPDNGTVLTVEQWTGIEWLLLYDYDYDIIFYPKEIEDYNYSWALNNLFIGFIVTKSSANNASVSVNLDKIEDDDDLCEIMFDYLIYLRKIKDIFKSYITSLDFVRKSNKPCQTEIIGFENLFNLNMCFSDSDNSDDMGVYPPIVISECPELQRIEITSTAENSKNTKGQSLYLYNLRLTDGDDGDTRDVYLNRTYFDELRFKADKDENGYWMMPINLDINGDENDEGYNVYDNIIIEGNAFIQTFTASHAVFNNLTFNYNRDRIYSPFYWIYLDNCKISQQFLDTLVTEWLVKPYLYGNSIALNNVTGGALSPTQITNLTNKGITVTIS